MKVILAASECVPFVKTGGLADVVGSLPKALQANGVQARVIMPLYGQIDAQWRNQMTLRQVFYVQMGWRQQYCGLFELEYEGIVYYFLDNEYFFRREYVYGLGGDEGERFSFFSKAVLEALPHIDFMPDVLHCHDWQAGMIPVLLATQYRHLPLYAHVRTMMTTHNLQYQGIFSIDEIEEYLSLGWDMFTSDKLEFYGMCNFMKGGMTYADAVTTVSPTYAQEITTPYYGERLEGLICARGDAVTGVLNGIDIHEYNPETDADIAKPYTYATLVRKQENKAALQAEMGLEQRPEAALIGMVTRLSSQKGLELVEYVLEELLREEDVQLAVLGVGEDRYVELFNWAQWKYPGRVAARIEMNHGLAHRIYAGSDAFLMPSKFEPCGLSQLIAMRYGTLPIARETGGLRDTVFSYNETTGTGNGFTFSNYNAHDMLYTIRRAISVWRGDAKAWKALQKRAMAGDYSWVKSAGVYAQLYEKIRWKGEE